MSFAPAGPPMYTAEFAERAILSPRVGRPMHQCAAVLRASTPGAAKPVLPELDGRKVLRTVMGSSSLSRVDIGVLAAASTSASVLALVPTTTQPPPGITAAISTNWRSRYDMQEARISKDSWDSGKISTALASFASERSRQLVEEPKLENSFTHLTFHLTQVWDKKLAVHGAKAAAGQADLVLQMKHELRNLDQDLNKIRGRRIKFSKTTLEMEKAAKELARNFLWDDWGAVHLRLQARRQRESDAFSAEIAGSCNLRVAELVKRQAKTRKALADKYTGELHMLQHEKSSEFKQLRQRYKNNLQVRHSPPCRPGWSNHLQIALP